MYLYKGTVTFGFLISPGLRLCAAVYLSWTGQSFPNTMNAAAPDGAPPRRIVKEKMC